MKKVINLIIVGLTVVLYSTAFAQTSGTLWIKTFDLGSASLNDPGLDREALAILDSLMQDENIEVTFLGAANTIGWQMNGKSVHPKISEAWNDAKRLSRARALKARYGRGTIGITHENIAGVKVVWIRQSAQDHYTRELNQIKEQNDGMNRELTHLKNKIESLQPEPATNGKNGKNGSNGHGKEVEISGHDYGWSLQAGVWAWQSSSDGNVLSPSLTLNIIIDKTAFVIQGGVTPWHVTSPEGNQAESFVYAGIKHMQTQRFGLTIGAFRGWEFFTATDNWSFKTTGASAGLALKYGIFEIQPSLTYSNINTLDNNSFWKFGGALGLNADINEIFKSNGSQN